MTNTELQTEIREIRVALIGIDGKNGLRGELRDFIDRYDARDEAYPSPPDGVYIIEETIKIKKR